MKLRLYRNSIRLRLTPNDVTTLLRDGAVHSSTRFTEASALAYEVRGDASATAIRIAADTGLLAVIVPATLLGDWATGDQVALKSEIELADGSRVRVLIEKEFACKHGEVDAGEVFFPDPPD